jgi:ABC-type multidrug transport system ATPase subunit
MDERGLRVEGLTKVYRGGWGLHDLTMEVPGACILALGGPNGSGKSTLLRCLAGLARFEGTARLHGRALDGSPAHRRVVGYLPQALGLPEHATIGETLELFGRLRGAAPDEGLLPSGFVRPPEDRIDELSGGQRHRVALAIALLGEPRLLLLDEPVANLDEEGRETFWRTLRRLRDERGVTAIVASPAPSELRGVADRAVYLTDGRLALEEVFDDGPGAPRPDPQLEGSP